MPRDLTITETSNGTTNVMPSSSEPNIAYNTGGATTDAYVTPEQIQDLTGSIDLQTYRDLTVASPVTLSTSGQALLLEAGRNLTVDAALQSVGTIRLVAADPNIPGYDLQGVLSLGATINVSTGTLALSGYQINEINGGAITAGTLQLSATLGAALMNTSNAITNVAGSAGGAVTLDDSNAVTILSFTTTNDNLSVSTSAGSITTAGAISLGTGALDLNSSGQITQTGGAITAGTAQITGSNVTLTTTSNAIANVAGTVIDSFALGDASAVSFGTLNAESLVVHDTASGQSISQTGAITADSAQFTTSGSISLNGANQIGMVSGSSGGDFTLVDTSSTVLLGALSVQGTLGISVGSGKIEATGPITTSTGFTYTSTGTSTISGISGNGGLTQQGTGTTTLSGANTYQGLTTIDAGTLILGGAPGATSNSGAASTGQIVFAGTSTTPVTLVLSTAAQPAVSQPTASHTFTNTLADFGANDTLDLQGFTYSAGDTAIVYDNMLTFTDASTGESEAFTLAGTHDADYFVHDAGSNGIAITDAPVCFASGTRIATEAGHIAVEDLSIGDRVVTSSGSLRRIVWLGHRAIDCRRRAHPHEVHPIRIAAHAFGNNLPARDLYVSPGHAICVDALGDALIPAVALVNGSTIQQVEVDSVTYWHVELDSHDILLAENLPAESYLDVGNRSFFVEEGIVSLASSPDAAIRTCADFCRPFHSGGPLVDTVRLQLDRRAIAMGWTRHGMEAADKLELQSVEAA